MTPQEMRERFAQLYTEMETSKDVSKMRLFGTSFTQVFDKISSTAPNLQCQSLMYFLQWNTIIM